MNNEDKGQIVLFQTEDGQTKLEVQLQDETVWLTIDQMAELFQRNRSTISRHIKRIYDDGELSKETTCAKFACIVSIRGFLPSTIPKGRFSHLDLSMLRYLRTTIHSRIYQQQTEMMLLLAFQHPATSQINVAYWVYCHV